MPRRFVLIALALAAPIGMVLACGSFGTDRSSDEAKEAGSSGDAIGVDGDDGASSDGGPIGDANESDVPLIECATKGGFTDQFDITGPSGFKEFESARIVPGSRIYFSALGPDAGNASQPKMYAYVLASNVINNPLPGQFAVGWSGSDIHGFVSEDERRVVFESKSDRGPDGADLLYVMERNDVGAHFLGSTAKPVTLDAGVAYTDIEEPWVAGASRIYFALTLSGADGVEQIWSGILDTASTPAKILNPKAHLELGNQLGMNPVPALGHPVVNSLGRRIYFSVEGSNGKKNIYVATRKSLLSNWDTPSVVTELNDIEQDDHPSWVSEDDCEILIVRDKKLRYAKRK